MISKHTQRGFGLIEILITLVVLAVGLIAIANLQGKLFQNSSAARERMAAANLAQKKLEDLRNFTQIASAPGTDTFGFEEIGTNSGGMKSGGSLLIPAGDHPIGNATYSLGWAVDEFTYADDDGAAQSCDDVPCVTPAFMTVTVNVTWTDTDGSPADLSLSGNISSLTPSTSAHTVASVNRGPGPVVSYVSSQDDVEIDTGDGDKVSKTPDPKIRQGGQNPTPIVEIVEVFVGEDGNVESMSEYITLACECRLAGVAEGREPTVKRLEGDNGRLSTVVGEMATKRTGVVNGQQQTDLCGDCCRDHHDHTASTFKYSPFRQDDYDDSGNHRHYYPDGGQLVEATDNDAPYLEACRFERVDGHLRLAPDWHLTSLQIMPASFIQTNQGDYQTYVENFIKDYVLGISGDYPEGYTPPVSTFPNEPTTDSMGVGQRKQYSARGIYIAPMEAALVEEIKNRINAEEPFLGIVPFNDVNLTKFVNWASLTDDGAVATTATVSNNSLSDGGANDRGLVVAVAQGPANIVAKLANDNTGLTNTVRIEPSQPDAEFFRQDTIILTVATDAPPSITPELSGSVSGPHQVLGGLNVNSSGGAYCQKEAVGSGGNINVSYLCAMSVTGNGTLTFSNYNRQQGQSIVNHAIIVAQGQDVPPFGVEVTVQSSGLLNETTSFQFSGVMEDYVLSFTVIEE